VHQYDEEYAEVKSARRPGRGASSREEVLKVKMVSLEKEYKNGFCKCWPLTLNGRLRPGIQDGQVMNGWTNTLLLLADMPDLTSAENLAALDRWEGSWAYLASLAWVKVTAAGEARTANFPPI